MLTRYLLSLCLSVRLSVRLSRIELMFDVEASFYLSHRKFEYLQKVGYWNCPKLRTHKISPRRCQQLVDVVDGRVCWRHLYDNRRVVAVYYTSRSTVTLSLLTSICCGFVLKLVYTVDKILTDIMRCVARTVCGSRVSCLMFFGAQRTITDGSIDSTADWVYFVFITTL